MTNGHSSRTGEFVSALEQFAPRYDVRLNAPAIARLGEYYELVMDWNARLHLVAPCAPTEFATRHVLESLFVLPFLTEGARIIDVGSGAGLPIIPCLILRPSLHATLIDSSQKKTIFLREALRLIGAQDSAKVIAGRFENMLAPEAEYVTCRALDRFTEMLPQLVEWAPDSSRLLLFTKEALGKQLENLSLDFKGLLLPDTERRFLFIVKK
ncbi:MAG: rRNA (guanine527-N7)-methyltransferase [Acidobacteriota bacterium]|jgi:16S rRNA (guanine527-N7)-methyltransferase|nr:rRNA (guanine527-N7)-methyltransferase [Acidobacteriota bacterium]